MLGSRSLRFPVLVAGVLGALLAFAPGAGAETFLGETQVLESESDSQAAEATLVKASATYESTVGSLSLSFTTTAAPQSEENPSAAFAEIVVAKVGACNISTTIEALEKAPKGLSPPALYIGTTYRQASTEGGLLSPAPVELTVPKTVSGATTTLSASSSALANAGFNCATVALDKAGKFSIMAVKLSPPPPSPAAPAPVPPPPAPTPAAAALAIAKPKPLTLKVGKWQTVKLTVTNQGGTATSPGSLRVKVPAGVLALPERQQVPALLPGASYTLSIRIKLTAKAKKKSTVSLTGAAPGATGATGSLVLEVKQ